MRRFDLRPVEQAQSDHNHPLCPNVEVVSEYKESAISYIAGFVVKIKEKHNCVPCSAPWTWPSIPSLLFLLSWRFAEAISRNNCCLYRVRALFSKDFANNLWQTSPGTWLSISCLEGSAKLQYEQNCSPGCTTTCLKPLLKTTMYTTW